MTTFFNNTRDYWRFFWPLATLSFISVLSTQLQLMVLTRYPDGVTEMANLAVASSLLIFFFSALIWVPQLTNAYGFSEASRAAVFRFVVRMGLVCMACFALLSWSPLGTWVIEEVFHSKETVVSIQTYCRWYTPVMLFESIRGYYLGLLIQNRKTGYVSLLNLSSLVCIAVLMYLGFQAKLPATTVVGGGYTVSSFLTMTFAWLTFRLRYSQKDIEETEVPSQHELWKFYLPTMLTGVFYTLSRPILVAFAARTNSPEIMMSMSRLVFEISFFLVAPLNQFRNMYVTFGKVDPRGVRNFSLLILIGIMTLMLLLLLTPLKYLLFERIYGLQEPLIGMLIQATWVILLIPVMMTVRNYYHGLCMIRKITGPMSNASVFRVAAIALVTWWLTEIGFFNQWTIPGVLVFGFFIETVMIAVSFRMKKYQPKQV